MTQHCSYEEMRKRAGSRRGESRREHPTPTQLPVVAPTTPEGRPWDLLSCRPPALPHPLPLQLMAREHRHICWDSLRSRRFSSSFLVQERSPRPSRHVGTTFLSPALPSEGYRCLRQASWRLPSPPGRLRESGAFTLPGERRGKGMNWGLTLPVSQPGWPRSWPPSGGKGRQEAGGACGPCPAMTAPPQLPHCSSPPELSEITASNSKFKLLQHITLNGFLHLINARRI